MAPLAVCCAREMSQCSVGNGFAPLLHEVVGVGQRHGRRAAADLPLQPLHGDGWDHHVLQANRHETLAEPLVPPPLQRFA